jgi:hypothetical protein
LNEIKLVRPAFGRVTQNALQNLKGARMSEPKQTRDLCAELTKLGAKVRVIQGGARFQQSGWPDRWLCHPAWHGHLEMKDVNGSLSSLQRSVIRDINARCPGTAFVVRFPNTLEDSDGNVLGMWYNEAGLLALLARVGHCQNVVSRDVLEAKGAKYSIGAIHRGA